MNVARLVLDCVERCGEYTAVYYEGRSFTNIERLRRAERLATVFIEFGVQPGDRVVVMMPNSPEVTAAFHALWRIGAVIVPLPPQLMPAEARYIIVRSGAQLVLTCPALVGRLREATSGLADVRHLLSFGAGEGAEDIEPHLAVADPIGSLHDCPHDELALFLFTSGTTGKPKGVTLTHGNLLSNLLSVAELYRPAPQTMMLHVLPLSHSFGVFCMNMEAVFGLRSAILPRFDAKRAFETIEEFRVQRFSAVPTMLISMCQFADSARYDCSSLEFVTTGGAALPEEVRLEFERRFGCRVRNNYGLSETAPVVSWYADGEAARPGSSGRPIPGVEVSIQDHEGRRPPPGRSGEICTRGPNLMPGYWNDPDATRAAIRDGWLHTGDVGHLDADGYLHITDRLKDIIIKGAENISPRQIEEALHSHPAVAEVAVIGLPDPKLGEEICAVVVLRAGQTATDAELREHTGRFVNRFRIPGRIVFRSDLPKSGVGKVLKRELRRELAGVSSWISDGTANLTLIQPAVHLS
jgi:long-chain acyl-CoA synthetase